MPTACVYITRIIPEEGLTPLSRAGFRLHVNPHPRPLRREELIDVVQNHAAVICQLYDRFDREVLKAAAGKCRIVATCAVGYDNIDIAAASELGIAVTNTPGVLTESTADLTWALLLATARRLGEAERCVRAGAWRGWGMMDFLGADVHGQTLGIIGAGRIGQAVARRASGFSTPLLYTSRSEKPAMADLGASRVPLDELLEKSDFVSLHVPYSDETHHLLDDRAFSRIKHGAILVNTARGSVVDQAAMIDALREGRLSAAGLDVYEKEPAVPEELLAMDNVVLLPHIGSATRSTRRRMAQMCAENVVAILEGRPPLNPVLP